MDTLQLLETIQIKNIQVKLSKPGIINKPPWLWPVVVFDVSGKTVTVSMKWWEQTASIDYNIDALILKLVHRTKYTSYTTPERTASWNLREKIRKKVKKAIQKAAKNKNSNLYKRLNSSQRKFRKDIFLLKFRRLCEQEIEYGDLRPKDFWDVWERVRREKIASEVMNS